MTIADFSLIQTSLSQLEHLVNIRFSVDENDVETSSFVDVTDDLLARPKLKRVKMDMCARTTFHRVFQRTNIEQLSIAWCQLQEFTYLLRFSPYLQTLKATICGLNDGKNSSKRSFVRL